MRLVIAAAVIGVGMGGAAAQDRFTMEKTPEGYVRLDSKTGQMSVCKESGAQLVCQLAADARTAYEDEVARLQEQLNTLEKRVAALESAGGGRGLNLPMPSEKQLDQTMSYMQRFFQGFADIVKDLDREFRGPDTPEAPIPDRT